jgi:glycine/D-amino acid oxidase-like deaminating enzyme
MKQLSDVIVIGSGIIGAATAFALMRGARRRVTLLEKGPLASGMTRRNAGLVHPFHAHAQLSELALASYTFYNQWAMHLGDNKSGYVETGAAVIANTDADKPKLDSLAQTLAPLTSAITHLERGALANLFPGVSTHFESGLFTPSAGYADAVATAQGLVKVAQERGMQLATGTQVKQLLTAHGRVQGAATTTGNFEAPVVIVAAGSWSERLLAPVGVALYLRSQRGAVLFYEQPDALAQGQPIFLDAQGAFFLRPHPYRMSAAGYIDDQTKTFGADTLDEYVPPQDAARVLQFAARCVPGLAKAQLKRGHTILYDMCADSLPALGRVTSVEGLYVAAGFGTSAFSVAPAVGELLAQLVIDGTALRDVSSFQPLRTSLRT